MRNLNRLLSASIAVVCLSSCANGPAPAVVTRVEVARQQIPPALLRCRDHPEPPPDPVTEVEYDAYVLDLAAAGDDCRRRLGVVRDIVVSPAAPAPIP